MTRVAHNFEGGTDGATLTAGSGGNTNIAGQSYFDSISLPAGGVAEFTGVSPYQGSLSGRFATRGTGGVCAVNWQAQFGTVTVDHFGRFFFSTDVIPAVWNGPILYMYNTALNKVVGSVWLFVSGAIVLRDSVDTIIATSTLILTPGNKYRIEYKVHPSATVSYITVRLYANPAARIASFTEELNAGGVTTWAGAADVGYVQHGFMDTRADWPSATEFIYFDSIVAGADDWVGPASIALANIDMTLFPKEKLRTVTA